MSDFDVTAELGPMFEIEAVSKHSSFSLEVGVKSSSLFASVSASETVDVLVLAAETLGAFRAVTIMGAFCNPVIDDLSSYAGVTKVAIAIGNSDFVVNKGLMTEGSWTWVPNSPIFVGSNGVLTQTPGALPVRRIGWAISATQINLDPYPIIGA